MNSIKLAKLPDRTPVKLTVTVSPELSRKLTRYAERYNEIYGNTEPEPISELVPFMLENFLDNDKDFVRTEKKRRRQVGQAEPMGGALIPSPEKGETLTSRPKLGVRA
jgi:hypothetical protein